MNAPINQSVRSVMPLWISFLPPEELILPLLSDHRVHVRVEEAANQHCLGLHHIVDVDGCVGVLKMKAALCYVLMQEMLLYVRAPHPTTQHCKILLLILIVFRN